MKKRNPFHNLNSNIEAAYEAASEVEAVQAAQPEELPPAPSVSAPESETLIQEAEVDSTKALEQSQTQIREYVEALQRERAEFANYKKRIERDQSQFRQEAVGNVVRRYLPAVDDLERALKNVPAEIKDENWVAGVEMIYQKMLNAIDSDGVIPIGSVGEVFDPNIHEAIGQAPSDVVASGHVMDVIQKGYIIGEKVLRPALVRVAE